MKLSAKFSGGLKLRQKVDGWLTLVLYFVGLILSVVLAPKPPTPKAAALSDFDLPTAEEDRPVPVLFGTKRITGANVLWYGDLQVLPIRKHSVFSSSTVGYRYYLGMHLGLCHGPVNALTKIEVGDKVAWSGPEVTGNTSIGIDQNGLFGGDDREGGLFGNVRAMFGAPTQVADTYLQSVQGTPNPGYRGIFGLVWERTAAGGYGFDHGYVGTTAYVKPWAVTLRRTTAGWFNDDPWYPAKANIGAGMNAAHIIYQCLTDPEWGQGSPASCINDAQFRAVADQLFVEGFGLSILWNQTATVKDFIQVVLDHVAGVLGFDHRTGLYELRLIRGDYDADALAAFDASNILEVTNFERRSWAETVNELSMTYTDPTTLQGTVIIVQDLGNIRSQGVRIPLAIDMSGITDPTLATTVVGRELAARATPLARLEFKVNRQFWTYGVASVVKITWPKYDLDQVVFRILNVKGGTLEDGRITVVAAEDIFGLSGIEYHEVTTAPAAPSIPSTPPPVADNAGTVTSTTTTHPPLSNLADGDRWLVPAGATGAWAGHAGQIAVWDEASSSWVFVDVPAGTIIYDDQTGTHVTVDDSGAAIAAPWTPAILGLSEDVDPDPTADFIVTYDASASAYKKVLAERLGGGASGGFEGYALTQAYLFFVKTEVVVPPFTWHLDRRIRGRGVVLDVISQVDTLPWQLHLFDANTGQHFGGVNWGGTYLRDVHWESDSVMKRPITLTTYQDRYFEPHCDRYFWAAGSVDTSFTHFAVVRKLDLRLFGLGNLIAGCAAASFVDETFALFLGVTKVGDRIYVSAHDDVTSIGTLIVLNADTLVEVTRWTYPNSDNLQPGLLCTNVDGEVWAINFDRDTAFSINLSNGHPHGTFALDYGHAGDAELVWNDGSDNWELWVAHLAFSATAPRMVRYRLTPDETGGHGANLGEFTGLDPDDNASTHLNFSSIIRDADLLSYGMIGEVRVYTLLAQEWSAAFGLITTVNYDQTVPEWFTPAFVSEQDLLPQVADDDEIDLLHSYFPTWQDSLGKTRRVTWDKVKKLIGASALNIAKGDIETRTSTGAARQPAGADGTVLTYDSTQPTGLKAVLPPVGAAASAARVSRSMPFALSTDDWSAVEWDTEEFDDEAYWTPTSPERLTIQRAGRYQISGNVSWDLGTHGGHRAVAIRSNGSHFVAIVDNSASLELAQVVSTTIDLAAGDYVELVVRSDAGSAVEVHVTDGAPHFSLARVGSLTVPITPRGCSWVRTQNAIFVPVNQPELYFSKKCVIRAVTIGTEGGSGSCVVDVWAALHANYPPVLANSICAGNKPTISGSRVLRDEVLAGWTTTIQAGSWLKFNLESSTVFTRIYFQLHLQEID